MNSKIVVILIILAILFYYCYVSIEYFSEYGMIVFERLDGSLIKKFKIGETIGFDNMDIKNLFKNNTEIKIILPPDYSAEVIYKQKYSNRLESEIMIKSYGIISKQLDNDWLIEQINIKYNNPQNNKIIVINRQGYTLFTTDIDSNINWDDIYSNHGLDDYYIVYPEGRRTLYYYNNHPSYRNHIKHHKRQKSHFE